MQQEIAAASDAALRKYHEDTPIDEKSNAGVADAMRLGAKEKSTKLYQKMHKLLTVANPALGPGFLEEVSSLHNTLVPCSHLKLHIGLHDNMLFWNDCVLLILDGESLEL